MILINRPGQHIAVLQFLACEFPFVLIVIYVSETEKPQENLKYTMRLFLVRLGFVGEEYKQARKILLRNLSGNCSWKSGHAPEHDSKGGASNV